MSDAIRMLALFLLMPLFIAAAADATPAGSMTEDSVDSLYVTPLGNLIQKHQKPSISHAQAVAAKYFSAEQLVKFAANLTSSPLEIFRDCGNIIKQSMDHYPSPNSQELLPLSTTISASRVSIYDIDPNLPTVPSGANILLTTDELHIMAAFLKTNDTKNSSCTCQRIFEWLNRSNSIGFQNPDEQGIPHHHPTDPVVEPEDLPQNDAQSSTLGDFVTQDCSAQPSENVTKTFNGKQFLANTDILEDRAASKAPSSLEQNVFTVSPNQTEGNASTALSDCDSLKNSVSTDEFRIFRSLTPSCSDQYSEFDVDSPESGSYREANFTKTESSILAAENPDQHLANPIDLVEECEGSEEVCRHPNSSFNAQAHVGRRSTSLSEYQEQTTLVDLPSTTSNNSRPMEELVSNLATQAETMSRPPGNQVAVVREVVFGIGQEPPSTIESASDPSIESRAQPAHQSIQTGEVEGQRISISQSSSLEKVSAFESTPTSIDVGQNASASATDPPIDSNAQPRNPTANPLSPRLQTIAPSFQASNTPGNVSEASVNATQPIFIDGKSLSEGEAEEIIDDFCENILSAANYLTESRTPVQPLSPSRDHERSSVASMQEGRASSDVTDIVVEADPTSEYNTVPLPEQRSPLPLMAPTLSEQAASTAAAAAAEDAEREASNPALQPVSTIIEPWAIEAPLSETQVIEPIPCQHQRRRENKPAGHLQPTSTSSCPTLTSAQCPPASTTSTDASEAGAQASAAIESQSIHQKPLVDKKESAAAAAAAPETRSGSRKDDGGSKWMSHILMAGGTVALVILIIASAYLSAKRRRQIKLRLEVTSELNTLGHESMTLEYPFRNPHLFACHTSSQQRPVWC